MDVRRKLDGCKEEGGWLYGGDGVDVERGRIDVGRNLGTSWRRWDAFS